MSERKPPIKKRKNQVLKEMDEARISSLPIIRQVLLERLERRYGGKQK